MAWFFFTNHGRFQIMQNIFDVYFRFKSHPKFKIFKVLFSNDKYKNFEKLGYDQKAISSCTKKFNRTMHPIKRCM